MRDAAISIKGLEKYYGTFHALKNINLDVPDKQTLVICGPSGSGKSTLIRCMNGLESYRSGFACGRRYQNVGSSAQTRWHGVPEL
jgi:general L-amino acid transport system ATP-binding protein